MVKIIESYTLHEQVGEGEFGKVYRGIDSRTGREVAVKVINVKRFKQNPKLEECTLNQIEVLSKVDSPFVVRFIQILKTVNNFYFFYEYCNGGTLDHQIKRNGHLSQTKINQYLEQLLEAFKILIANNIMHRDLKPSNIMIHNGKIKLGDFGFCKSLETQRDLAQTMLGSPIYMAPQILKGQIYTIKADIWSLGVVIYEMAFGFCPFEQSSIAKLINVLEHQELTINKDINPISQHLQALLKKCLVKDHFKRITWDELFSSFKPPLSTEHHSSGKHERVLSDYNRLPRRQSDLNDKPKLTEEPKMFKKKTRAEQEPAEDCHSLIGKLVKLVDKFIAFNAYPEITVSLAAKCYKMIEREHRKLGIKYLKERVELSQAVIQIQALIQEEEKNRSDENLVEFIRKKLDPKQADSFLKIVKQVDLNEKITVSEAWVQSLGNDFIQSGLLQTL